MNPQTAVPTTSELHRLAKRERALAIGRLAARLVAKAANVVNGLRLRQPISQTLAHWG